ncbi:hypothetical protein D3C73_1329180 [compost metagenome]
MLGDLFLVPEDQIQRPQRNAQHDDDVSHGANLYIDLIRDDGHHHDQPVANQAAE